LMVNYGGRSGRSGGTTWSNHTHGPAAEKLLEGAECDAETEDAGKAKEAATAAGGAAEDGPGAAADATAGAAAGGRPPRPDNDGLRKSTTRRTLPQEEWGKTTREQRKNWRLRQASKR